MLPLLLLPTPWCVLGVRDGVSYLVRYRLAVVFLLRLFLSLIFVGSLRPTLVFLIFATVSVRYFSLCFEGSDFCAPPNRK